MLRAVLLDVDGTLVDSNDAHARAWAEALREFGFATSLTQIRRWIGMGGDKILPRVDPALDEGNALGKAISDRRLRIFLERHASGLEPMPGAAALLDHFGARRLLRVAATSAKEAEFKAIVKAAGIQTRLDLWTTADDADRSKPDADIIRSALAKAKIDKTETLYLGDTPYDIEAAHRAGIPIIAFQCGGWSKPALSAAEAVYETPAQLLTDYDRSFIVNRWKEEP
jgi:HAD superfamily hydrolase (TIGR01509 family)